jgi:hypothetical protein
VAIDTMMSKNPLKMKKKLITAASAANVSPGWMNATIPTPTNSKPSSPCKIFHHPWDAASRKNSFTPARIATTPKRMEIALTDV